MIACGTNQMTEVVSFVTNDSPPSFGQIPSYREGAVGAMFGNTPIICGGINGNGPPYYDSCLSFQNSQWSQTHTMTKERIYPAGIQLDSITLWILGGKISDPNFRDSTEFIIQGQTNGFPGPKLPYGLENFCGVKLSEDEIFVIGGRDQSYNHRNEVWIYNPQNEFSRNQGPSLTTARRGHSCSIMRDGEATFIVVAGGNTNGEHVLNSVEIYDPTDKTWHSGRTNSK